MQMILSNGIERWLNWPAITGLWMLHAFVVIHSVFILVALFHYRYLLITKGSASLRTLLISLSITAGTALFVSGNLAAGVWASHYRSPEFYLSKINRSLFADIGRQAAAIAASQFNRKILDVDKLYVYTVDFNVCIHSYKSAPSLINKICSLTCSQKLDSQLVTLEFRSLRLFASFTPTKLGRLCARER